MCKDRTVNNNGKDDKGFEYLPKETPPEVLEHLYVESLQVTFPLGGNLSFPKNEETLADELNRLLIGYLEDWVKYLQEIVDYIGFNVDTVDRTGVLGPVPSEEEIAETEATDRVFNEAEAKKLEDRKAWAKPRLEECKTILERLKAQPHKF